MTTAIAFRTAPAGARDDARIEAAASIAPRALGHTLLLGIAADVLLRDGIDGAGFPSWIAMLSLALTSLTWRAHREVPRQAAAWMLIAQVSAFGLAWRDAGMLQFLDVIATAGALDMTAIALGNDRAGLLADRFRDTLWAGASMVRTMVPGLMPNLASALHDARRGDSWGARGRGSFRLVAPDAIVAQFNLGRVRPGVQAAGADLRHMSELSAEAVDVAIQATLGAPRSVSESPARTQEDRARSVSGSPVRTQEDRARSAAAINLMSPWGPTSHAAGHRDDDVAWRGWNAGERNAVRLVGANAGALRRVQHSACAGIPLAERDSGFGYDAP